MTSDPQSSHAAQFRKVQWCEEMAILAARVQEQLPQDAPFRALAFSGGGIRSATFNLGVLQALCEAKLLTCFDYLSTVSGGGYIGGWLSAQLKHGRSLDELQTALSPTVPAQPAALGDVPKTPEDKSIGFLRQYS